MPLLDEFTRKMHAILPQWMAGQMTPAGDSMGGMVPGQAQLRSPGHPSAFILPQDQYQSAVNAFGRGGEQGMTLRDPGMAEWLLSRFTAPDRAMYASGKVGPTVIVPQDASPATRQHEAIHAFLGRTGGQLNPTQVNALIPQEARESLGRYYSPAQMAEEVPARTNEPHSMQLDSGSDVRRKYLEMLRGVDPSKAAALGKWWGLSGSEKGDNAAVLQKPNDTF